MADFDISLPPPAGTDPAQWAKLGTQGQLSVLQSQNVPAPAPLPVAPGPNVPQNVNIGPRGFAPPPPPPQGPIPFTNQGPSAVRNPMVPGAPATIRTLVDPEKMNVNQMEWEQSVGSKLNEAKDTEKLAQTLLAGGSDQAQALTGLAGEHQKLFMDQSDTAKTLRNEATMKLQAADDFANSIKNQKIDPNGFWSNDPEHPGRTVGRAMFGVIAASLGGIAQGFLHLQHNEAMEQINKLVDNDIAAQKANFEANKEKTNSLYAQAFKQTGNADEAEKLAKMYGMQAAAYNVEAVGAASGSQAAAAKAQIQAEQLRTESHKIALEGINDYFKNTKFTPATGKTRLAQDPAVQKAAFDIYMKAAEGGQNITPDQALKNAMELKKPGTQQGTYADIAKVEKPSPEDKAENKENRANQDYLASLHLLKEHMAQGGSVLYGTGASLLADAKVKARSASVGRPASEELIGQTLPSGTSLTNINAERLDHAIKEAEAAASRRGDQGTTQPYRFTPAGQ